MPEESCQDARLGCFVESFGFARMAGWGLEACLAVVSVRSSAQSAWIWATVNVRSHADFLKNSLAWLNEIKAWDWES